ncbi:hypothetical protein HPB48_023624 [Haemaphysalis longicornis]|uniref:H15 domain-containing protein n=1 Tax=Haemaphysalis longicornis TaxID=44386 RepID=A0A9J6H5P1_HAELO|nr:hypothetical protein HPB48_023624 [Haemaphysalis longicornis]
MNAPAGAEEPAAIPGPSAPRSTTPGEAGGQKEPRQARQLLAPSNSVNAPGSVKEKQQGWGRSHSTVRHHPAVEVMALHAVRALGQPRGCSLHAIKKYIGENYDVDVTRLGPLISKFITKALSTGDLDHVTGKGLIGKIKLGISLRR